MMSDEILLSCRHLKTKLVQRYNLCMAVTALKQTHSPQKVESYKNFKKLNGDHPLKSACPSSYILYKTRKRRGGKIRFFNFGLAKEMGLISSKHPNELTSKLKKEIHDQFSFLIINEYDLENETKFPKKDLREGEYMATRYLQLQHPNKQGRTSGDGRSVWLGQIKNRGKMWDVSSAGIGATSLSPATHIYNKYFESGDPSISYGCGYAEIDEGFETLFFSEVLHKNKYSTERILAIIDFGNGISINVRAHENLIRPSHMFNWYKQRDKVNLRAIVDYYIDSQRVRKNWKDIPEGQEKYQYFFDKQLDVFARLSADFEDDYIFCWLDWDGDNILMDGGIIDYGSIRQFGLFHHEYRFDDVSQYSTNIKEQKHKAKMIVHTFYGIVSFLTKNKFKEVSKKELSKVSKKFDSIFNERKKYNALRKIGFNKDQIEFLLNESGQELKSYMSAFSYFERAKSKSGLVEVSDGITCDALFCMRDILRDLPQIFLHRSSENIKNEEFMSIIKSNYASAEDLKISSYRSKMIKQFQKNYFKLIKKVASESNVSYEKILLQVTMRSSIINRYDRVTGDSISHIVQKVLSQLKEIKPEQTYELVNLFSLSQDLTSKAKDKPSYRYHNSSELLKSFFRIVRNHRDGI